MSPRGQFLIDTGNFHKSL